MKRSYLFPNKALDDVAHFLVFRARENSEEQKCFMTSVSVNGCNSLSTNFMFL